MAHLNGKILRLPLKKDLSRIGDLLFFEGPLMTLFEDKKNKLFYVFDWVDRNEKVNRWLVYLVTPVEILNFIDGEISHKSLICSNKTYHIVDVDTHAHFKNVAFIEFNQIPQSYLPESDTYFDISDSPKYLQIKDYLLNTINTNTLSVSI